VGVDGDYFIDAGVEKFSHYSAGDTFAGMEAFVLAHVTQIRSDENDFLCAKVFGGMGSEDDVKQ